MQGNPGAQVSNDSPLSAWGRRIAATALLLANLVIIVLALKDQWGFLQVLYVCWFEAIIIGAYNLLKMLVVILFGHPFGERFTHRVSFENRMAVGFWGFIALGFFIAKFAGLALATGFLLLMLPVKLQALQAGHHVAGNDSLTVMSDSFQGVTAGLPTILLSLVISHGVSFVVNFLGRREYQRTLIFVLLFWPYARMALVFGVLILAGVAAALAPPFSRTSVFAVAVVCLKIVADLATHRFEHSRQPAVPPRIPVPPVQVAGAVV